MSQQMLEDKITKLELMVNKLETNVTVFGEMISEMKQFVQKHREIIYGNGKDGCLTKISKLESATRFMWAVVVLAIATTASALTLLWTNLFAHIAK